MFGKGSEVREIGLYIIMLPKAVKHIISIVSSKTLIEFLFLCK